MILCAAIKYYIEATNIEVVVCGWRHGSIIETIRDLGFSPRKGYKEIEQGFINHKNEFLNRYDAYNHAVECGQLTQTTRWHKEDHGERELYSEDIY